MEAKETCKICVRLNQSFFFQYASKFFLSILTMTISQQFTVSVSTSRVFFWNSVYSCSSAEMQPPTRLDPHWHLRGHLTHYRRGHGTRGHVCTLIRILGRTCCDHNRLFVLVVLGNITLTGWVYIYTRLEAPSRSLNCTSSCSFDIKWEVLTYTIIKREVYRHLDKNSIRNCQRQVINN